MNKRYIFLGVLLSLIFIGGFLSGVFFSKEDNELSSLKSKDAPISTKIPFKKEIPRIEDKRSNVLIGYVQDFRNPNDIPYSKLTHIIFSFAHPTKDGGLLFTGDHALKNLQTIVSKAEEHNTKVLLAIGGWYHMNGGESYDYFSAALANPTSQKKLVNELLKVINREKLDGIDIDFEHPRTEADSKNLNTFITDLSKQLHSNNKELSIAVHSKIHGSTLTELGYVKYEPSMFHNVDYVNIMAYDGQWDGGYNPQNLAPYPFTERIVSYWASLFDSHNVSKRKLVLGVPFYAQPVDPKIKQVSYEAIIQDNPANATKDVIKMNGTTYYYNGQTMMTKKTKLAIENNFGGMMIWELGLDSKDDYSLTRTIFNELNSKKKLISYYENKK
ncbi:glycoside hydrolase family 18 protein [Fredinandcohnia humi]